MPDASSPRWRDDALPRAAAIGGTAALLVLAGKLLGGMPRLAEHARPDPARVQLVFSARAPAVPAVVALAPAGASAAIAPPAAAGRRGQAAEAPVARPATAARPPVALYDAQGRVQLPAAAVDRWTSVPAPAAPPGAAARAPAAAEEDPLQRPNPVEARTTRFAGDWVSDGDIADVAAQEIARAQRKIAEFLFGGDIRHARARPSPEVRFNPARHERGADLGSEATGDAYKAAPISYQPAPGLDGEASRRIREQVAALETAYARCDRARLRRLMQPLLAHLDELQKAEAAHARGADPVRAEHMLPNTANGAYDMARRALWYADRQMAGCGG